jgi:hypothetical protein
MSVKKLYEDYIKNNYFIECIILSGLEVMDNMKDLLHFLKEIKNYTNLPVVIFTGYKEEEVADKIKQIKEVTDRKLVFKFGRYQPYQKPRYDEVGGITLASGNQYFKVI